ncbi:MAG TPA: GNAT family protein, partial [Ilumatobacteraceae bacterium]|nr:GNAT family protein [Ilumatobacteraceae bacterium]
LNTPRLTIRMMRSEHAPRLIEYRNDPEVARYQDWDVPFTEEMADSLIESQQSYDGLVDDFIVQLAIEVGGVAIGDLAVGLYDSGRQATLGYSVMSAAQRKGFATEAAQAIVAALFDEVGVHRIVATIDPGNSASRRVLEKLGFRHEGRSLSSAFVRGEWVDDDRFALLASEHAGIRSSGRT